MDTLGAIFYTLGSAYVAFVAVVEFRHFTRRFLSSRWPTVTATIRAESIGSLGKGGRAAFFIYDFIVNDTPYTGRFAVMSLTGEDQGRKLLNKLDGLPISIRYNPKRPKISLLVNLFDMRFDGAIGTQNPYWYMNRSEIPGEPIRLFPTK